MSREGGREDSSERGQKGREIDYREVAPPGQDSCQPGPDMTSTEGEAGRHSQWLGGVRGWHQGAVQRGASSRAVHAQLCLLSSLTSWQLFSVFLKRTTVSQPHKKKLTGYLPYKKGHD